MTDAHDPNGHGLRGPLGLALGDVVPGGLVLGLGGHGGGGVLARGVNERRLEGGRLRGGRWGGRGNLRRGNLKGPGLASLEGRGLRHHGGVGDHREHLGGGSLHEPCGCHGLRDGGVRLARGSLGGKRGLIDLVEVLGLLGLARCGHEAARADVLEHAEERRHAGLVVVGPKRAGGEALVDGASGQHEAGDGDEDAKDPQGDAGPARDEGEGLDERAGRGHVGAGLGERGQEREVGRYGGGVEEVLAGGVVVGHDDDAAAALGHLRAGRAVDRDHVLAAGLGAKRGRGLPAKGPQERQDGRDGREDEAREREREKADAGDQHADEHDDGKEGAAQTGQQGRVELLDARLDVVLGHELGDGLGSLQLLLAVGGCDVDSLVEEVEVIVCHCHDGVLLKRLAGVRCVRIQSKRVYVLCLCLRKKT